MVSQASSFPFKIEILFGFNARMRRGKKLQVLVFLKLKTHFKRVKSCWWGGGNVSHNRRTLSAQITYATTIIDRAKVFDFKYFSD